MITVEEAIQIISSCKKDFGVETIPLEAAEGRILREDWRTDRDLPPYDRVTMDGIAIKYEQFVSGRRSFPIEGIAAAGMAQMRLQNDEHCLEVMTGAVTPLNTDVIIRYEDLAIENNTATFLLDQVSHYQNIHFKGEDRKQGELIVPSGTRISPAEIGVGASIGRDLIQVARLPKAMVISTGDELVDIRETPQAHQIRRSNVYRIKAALSRMGLETMSSHLNDDKAELREKLAEYLATYDILILSGGVSKGKFDYLPEVLSELGVEKLFHKISQRPGKPFWFGKTNRCTVFALPGNPVSSFLCTQKYFKHWLNLCLLDGQPKPIYAELQADVHFKPDLTYFLEVDISYDQNGKCLAMPKKGNGSGDLANLVRADAFIELTKGKDLYQKGEVYPILIFR